MKLKQTLQELALFGGRPLFTTPKTIGQLAAPDVEDFLRTFRKSYDARYLTNDGPLVRQLEQCLAELHETRHCIALANAGLGITMLIQHFAGGRGGEVIIPAFSYRGLPHFIQWAGQMPRFCDVDPATHGLDPAALDAAIDDRVTSILAVANFNDPGDIDGLCRVARRHRVPLFIDSVYAVGASYRGRILGSFSVAEVYSLHATKLLNGFEGGYVTTNDDAIAEILRSQRNFLLPPIRLDDSVDLSHLIGCNAKLNEMHAAMALLAIDGMDATIERNRERFMRYRERLEGVPGVELVPYASGERANYQMAVLGVTRDWPLTRDQTVALLRSEGVGINPYYSPPLPRSEHCPPGLKVPPMPVSEELAAKYVQLPVGELVSLEDIDCLCAVLELAAVEGKAIARRLAESGPS